MIRIVILRRVRRIVIQRRVKIMVRRMVEGEEEGRRMVEGEEDCEGE